MSNPGDLDTTFGTNGKVTTDFNGNGGMANSVALQSDGKIILGGGSNNDFALARYNTNGSLDTTFGSGGKVNTDFNGTGDMANSVALQSDGKIILGGASNSKFALARYNTDGSLDTTFGTGGKVTTDFSGNWDSGNSVVLQSDNKIILGGFHYDKNWYGYFTLARYNTNGSLDTTFGTNGLVANVYGTGTSVVLQPNGKIIFVGSNPINGFYDFILARYNTDGSLDTTFGTNGKVNTDFSGMHDTCNSVALQSDGKIILGGDTYNGSSYDFALARYNIDGSLDTTFGINGKVTTDFNGNNEFAYSVALQPNGKIILGGQAYIGSNNNFALVRYNIDGSLDTTFGTNGKVTTIFKNDDQGRSVVLQQDGKIILGGYASNGSNYDFALARYIGDPPITLPISNICFLENSLVSTDQGFIEIQDIDEDIHTINNKEIVCLTKTVTEEPHLICIEKNALGKNIPSQDTILSYNHKILCNGELVSASELLDTNNKIYKVRYTGETLYNILMKDYEEIEVNGLKCETLHPQNRVAHLYLLLKEQPEEYQQYIIQNYNARFSSVGQM